MAFLGKNSMISRGAFLVVNNLKNNWLTALVGLFLFFVFGCSTSEKVGSGDHYSQWRQKTLGEQLKHQKADYRPLYDDAQNILFYDENGRIVGRAVVRN